MRPRYDFFDMPALDLIEEDGLGPLRLRIIFITELT